MKMYGFDDNYKPQKYIVIAENFNEAYAELYKKGIVAGVGEVYEIDTTVVMIHNPYAGITRVTELRDKQ